MISGAPLRPAPEIFAFKVSFGTTYADALGVDRFTDWDAGDSPSVARPLVRLPVLLVQLG